jgi:YihY family inner membrane protein
MTTARTVPVTIEMDGDELDAADAWQVVRKVGVRRLLVDAFTRFRFGDGTTNSRALALQTALAVLPFLLALTGLATQLDQEGAAKVVAATIEAVSPGGGGSDALARAVSGDESSEDAGEIALGFGLVLGALSMTVAMAQVERGLNRLYGIERDRPLVVKYGRAAVIAAAVAVPAAAAFLLLVAGQAFGEAMAQHAGWDAGAVRWWNVLRWPAGLVLSVLAIAGMLNHAPRRRQPGLSWLALGGGIAVVLSMTATGLLAAYVKASGSFGQTYGPLAGIVALLLWALMSSAALFYGAAVSAQLEACRAGDADPVEANPGPPGRTRVDG